MLSVGLTGGIASGKSLAATFFAEHGAYLIDADVISRDIVMPGQEGHRKVVEEFGVAILAEDGAIDRKKLGDVVFADAAKRGMLNSILHPLIIGRIQKEIEQRAAVCPESITIVDVPLLIECGMYHDFDRIVVVVADRNIQKARLMERNCLKNGEAEDRLRAQMAIMEKTKYADYIIDNNGSREELERQVARTYALLVHDSTHINGLSSHI